MQFLYAYDDVLANTYVPPYLMKHLTFVCRNVCECTMC